MTVEVMWGLLVVAYLVMVVAGSLVLLGAVDALVDRCSRKRR